MLPVIADHIKAHRHQVRQHAVFIGSGVVIPPKDLAAEQVLADMAIDWAGDRLEPVIQELRAERALAMMAEEMPDQGQRCRMLAEKLQGFRPAEGHIRLARMIKDGYFSTIFLAEPDRLLEEALQVHHLVPEKDYHHFVAGVDDADAIALGVLESSRLSIVKCGGDVQSKNLPLVADEMAANYAGIHDVIQEIFRAFTLILAYTERDRPFLEHVSRDGRRMFWINPVIPVSDQRHFDELKMASPASVRYHSYQPEVVDLLTARSSSRHLICREAGNFNDFMAKLHMRISLRRRHRSDRTRKTLTILSGGPYRFLEHFDVEDADLFFGREDDTNALVEMIADTSPTVLFGRSGIGKTSLLRAGVMGALARESEEAASDEPKDAPWLTVYSRCLDDPLVSIKEAALVAVSELGHETDKLSEEEHLLKFLQQIHELTNRRILIVMDQFEEYFVRLGDRVKAEFLDEWTACLDAAPDYLRWIVGLREDYLGDLYDLHTRIPTIMHNMYRLKKLTRQQARDAIVKPALSFDVHLETELVEELLDDLSREGVEPTHLQIVCDRLFEAKPVGQHTISLHGYLRLGRVQKILSEYLDYALSQLPYQDRRVGRDILKYMASSSEVVVTSPIGRIAEQLGYEQDEVERVMAKLLDLRLLRAVEEERRQHYELVHEYLADEIEGWMSESEIEVKDVQDLVARELNNYHKFGVLIGVEELRIIHDKHEDLALSLEELELVLRSSAQAGEEVEFWFGRLDELGDRQRPLMKSLLRSNDNKVRLIAAEALGRSPQIYYLPDLVRMLDSGDIHLADTAIKILDELERPLIDLLGRPDNRVRVLAVQALGAIKSQRAIARLMEVVATADDVLRDAITDALIALKEPAAHEMFLRRMVSREGISWPGAHVLAALAAHDEEVLAKLRRQAERLERDPRALYAVGMANMYAHQLGLAQEQLQKAAVLAESDSQGSRQIATALSELQMQETRLSDSTETWLCFQGNTAHTGLAETELRPPLKTIWRFETEGPIFSSPVISRGLVYIGSRDGNLYAVDTVRGTQQWKLATQDQIEVTPAIWDDLVFVGSHDGFVYAAEANTGKLQWKTRLGHSIRSSPVVAGGNVLIGDRAGRVNALAADTGKVVWQFPTHDEITASPAVAGDTAVVGSWDGEIYALNTADGELRWRCSTQGPVASSLTIQGGLVCGGSDDANVYAVDLATGDLVWRRPVGGFARSSAAATESLFVIGCLDGRVYALEHDTGQIRWQTETEDEILASAAIAGRYVYLGSIDGSLYALDLESGQIVWSHKTLYGVYSTPAVVGDTLYVGIEHYFLVAFRSDADASD